MSKVAAALPIIVVAAVMLFTLACSTGGSAGPSLPAAAATATVSVPVAPPTPGPTPKPGISSAEPAGEWVTSVHPGSQYYYPVRDPRWRSLAPDERVWFATEEDLLARYPDRIQP